MKASEVSLLKILDGTKQFLIPTYQRTYSRTEKQCQQLRNDILTVAKNPNIKSHFVWGIVRITEQDVWGVSILSIIDWQQRITTVSLLIIALAHVYNDIWEDKETTKLLNRYILVDDDKLRYKLIPTKLDKEVYSKLVDNYDVTAYGESQIMANYSFFLDQISKHKDELDVIGEGIAKLYIVDIALERWEDNPQLIFESMNSTGLALSKAELIKNYLLMGIPAREQDNLYQKYWYPMDTLLERNQSLYDDFVRDYLTYNSESWIIPAYRDLYDAFKNYLTKSGKSTEEILQHMYGIFKWYTRFTLLEPDPDKDITQVLEDINNLKVNVAYPLLIELFHDYQDGKWILSKEHMLKILRAIESYVFRRAICWIPSASLNKTFATYKKNLIKTSSQSYYESFMAYLLDLDSYRIFPRDELFISELMLKDVYSFRNSKYLLEKLENFERREKVSLSDYSIEHIMPQNKNLNSAWQQELWESRKEVHAKYVNTLWNLTLIHSGNNSAFSDNSFSDKKKLPNNGFDTSPLYLNESVRTETSWTDEAINKRASLLANKATKVWSLDVLWDEIISKYTSKQEEEKEYNYDSYSHLVWKNMDLFMHLQEKVLGLHPEVEEHCRKLYIAYTYDGNFLCIEPQSNKLRLSINMDIEEIIDPKGICKDVRWVGKRWTGNVSVHLNDISELDYVIWLVQQSLDKQLG